MNPLTRTIASYLPNQFHKHAIEVDSHLRVKGAPSGTFYAIGDCCNVETNVADHVLEFVDAYDTDCDDRISWQEVRVLLLLPTLNRRLTRETREAESSGQR